MKRAFLHAVTTTSAIMALGAPAAATQFELGGGIDLDFNAGADKIGTLVFSDNSSQDLYLGNGVALAAGAGAIFFGPQPHRLETTLTIGVKYSTMQQTSNADLSFVRVPVELLAFYRNDKLYFRVGGGGAAYLVNSLTGSGLLSGLDVTFDPAFAGIVEADFVLKGFYAGLRYTALTLHAPNPSVNFAANTIGVVLGYYYHFPGE